MGDDGWGLTDEVTSDTSDSGESDGGSALAEPAETTNGEVSTEAETDAEVETEPEDDSSDETDEPETLEDRLRAAVDADDITNVTTSDVMNNYKEVDDADLLKEALRRDTRKSSLKLYRRQLRNLGYDVKDDTGAPDGGVSVDEGVRKSEQTGLDETSDNGADETTDDSSDTSDEPVEMGDEGEPEAETETSDESPDGDGTSGDADGETEPDVEPEPETPQQPEQPEQQSGVDTLEADGATAEPAEQAAQTASSTQSATVSETDDSDGISPIDASDIAPDAMSVSEAAQKQRRHKIMTFGPPGTFKTHFGYTMPEPIVIIDTEGKSHDIAHKFSDKAIHILQPSNYLEAAGGTDRRGTYQEGALEKALNLLDRYREEQGVIGTLMVDSMSKMWEWSQLHYISKWHPDDDRPLEEIREEFNSGLESNGPGSWGRIKRYHNAQFRQPMVDSPYHLYWTAKQKEDYSVVFDDDSNSGNDVPLIPDGEKDNIHEVDTIIHAHLENGDKVGDMKKAGFTDHGYHNMKYPTFPKHKRIIENISDWEAEDDVPNRVEMDGEHIDIVRGVTVLE